MLRETLIWASRQRRIGDLFEKRAILSRGVRRFVAGVTLEDVLRVARDLRARGLSTTIDYLGESVRSDEDAQNAASECCRALHAVARNELDRNISVKLTQFGLELDERLCLENLRRIASEASRLDAFVRIDMESSAVTAATLRLFETVRSIHPRFGVVLQAYLHRTPEDLERLIATETPIRLCKGAYDEPASVALATKAEVDQRYRDLMLRLLDSGTYPAIATHDEVLIDAACRYAAERNISKDRFEFQMLFGIRRDLQARLVASGYRVRVYVPYGPNWFAYLMRRLAERPANVTFLISSVLREHLAGRRDG